MCGQYVYFRCRYTTARLRAAGILILEVINSIDQSRPGVDADGSNNCLVPDIDPEILCFGDMDRCIVLRLDRTDGNAISVARAYAAVVVRNRVSPLRRRLDRDRFTVKLHLTDATGYLLVHV